MAFDDIKQFTIQLLAKLPLKKMEEAWKVVLNKCNDQEVEISALKVDLQKAKDEINRLKGEKGKPKIAPNKNEKDPDDDSDDKGAGPSGRGKNKRPKDLEAHQTKEIDVDKKDLPDDAESKGEREVIIQDLDFKLNNIKFVLKKYYSPSLGKTFEAKLPPEYKNSLFGPGIWAFVIQFHYEARMTQNLIHKVLLGVGIQISEGEISKIILRHEEFETEQKLAREAGIERGGFTQIDDTGARLNGKNGFSIATCNSYFTDYYTGFSKSRESALRALAGAELKYLINGVAIDYIDSKIGNKRIVKNLRQIKSSHIYTQKEFIEKIQNSDWLNQETDSIKKHVREGAALGAYRANFLGARSTILICDDAPQFKGILEYLGLCLIHEERHYKKLTPKIDEFIKALEGFRKEFWIFYDELKVYKLCPSVEQKKLLSKKFDDLFSGQSSYYALNALMEKTRAKKEELLLCLDFPEIPLHNNTSELAMRERVIQRKIRGYFRSMEGAHASDVFLGLMGTCRKIGVSFGAFIKDRIYQKYDIPPLSDLIWMADPIIV